MLTEAEIERMARHLCELRGLHPDDRVYDAPLNGGASAQGNNRGMPVYSENWRIAKRDLNAALEGVGWVEDEAEQEEEQATCPVCEARLRVIFSDGHVSHLDEE